MTFEIKDRDAAGRLCKFKTKHGTITTPTLLPVINPNKQIITAKEMKQLFQTEIVITNSYIIKKDEKLKQKALKNGVHKLIEFDGPIMTDSGTFQSYVYGDLNIDPIDIVKFQRDIGSDIGTILDVFGTPKQTKKQAQHSIQETIKRAKLSHKIKKNMLLATTVQGSIYPDLRKTCAEKLSELESDFFPIGGVVPIMENQRYTDLVRIILASKKGLNPSKPVHLFGAGHPLIFPLAVALGCDLFDSSAYAKYAQDERMIFSWGTEKLEDLTELPCHCPICTNTTSNELKKMHQNEKTRQIAKHNLYVSFSEIKKIRNAIRQGTLWELVERRATANPHLQESLKVLKTIDNKKWLEQFEPITKNKALFYTGNHTIHRPIIYRLHKRLQKNYIFYNKNTIVLPEGKKPYQKHYAEEIAAILNQYQTNIIINSHLGPAPIELDEFYPFAQSITPKEIDKETQNFLDQVFKEFTKNTKIIKWQNKQNGKQKHEINIDLQKIMAIADMQFQNRSSKSLFKGKIKLVKSKKTGKIRNIYANSEHILSMRASDGKFTLKIHGARLLHKTLKKPKLRVTISKDAEPFILEGKSVFAKFILECDDELRPYDECLIVNEKDELLGVGRTLMNRQEMLAFTNGMAVKTRETI